jgi:hypothetical protein
MRPSKWWSVGSTRAAQDAASGCFMRDQLDQNYRRPMCSLHSVSVCAACATRYRTVVAARARTVTARCSLKGCCLEVTPARRSTGQPPRGSPDAEAGWRRCPPPMPMPRGSAPGRPRRSPPHRSARNASRRSRAKDSNGGRWTSRPPRSLRRASARRSHSSRPRTPTRAQPPRDAAAGAGPRTLTREGGLRGASATRTCAKRARRTSQ